MFSSNPPHIWITTNGFLPASFDMTWQVYVKDFLVSLDNEVLSPYSATLSLSTLPGLIQRLDSATICHGNFEPQFIEIAQARKGRFLSSDGETVIAILDDKVCINVDGVWYFATVRHINCSLLLAGLSICSACLNYRNTLQALVTRYKKPSTLTAHINTRY